MRTHAGWKLMVASLLGAFVLGCGTGGNGATTGNLTVTAHSATAFDATYHLGSAWVRAEVAYTPSTTFYRIWTSNGTEVVRTGTALRGDQDAALAADRRRVEGVLQLAPTDPEYALVTGLLDALIAAGADSKPSAAQAGSTQYAAAYFVARALGRVPLVQAGEAPSRHTEWPYPGYYRRDDVPAVLRVQVDGQQNGSGSITCCGPFTCANADWNPGIICDDWCAAGDFCNYHGWGNCGTAAFYPGGGCNNCPHSDSPTIKSYSLHGCNTGSCSVRCWEPTPTRYGPASNFNYYGNYYYGSGGGQYGSGPNDYCCF
jgi:hypothetical protein